MYLDSSEARNSTALLTARDSKYGTGSMWKCPINSAASAMVGSARSGLSVRWNCSLSIIA